MSSTELPGAHFGEWISEGWRMFTEQWKAWVLLALGYFVVMIVPSIAVMFAAFSLAFANAATQAGPYGRSAAPAFPAFIVFVVSILSILVLVPLSAYFKGGMYKSAFKQLRGGTLEFRDLLSAGDCFLPLVGETLLVGVIVLIGTMLCIIPGIIAAGLLMFAGPLIVERKMGVIEAMQESYEMTKQNMLIFALFAFILQLIMQAGTYVCYVGVLATYPLMFTMGAVAYRDCFGLSGARSFRGPKAAAIPQYSTPNPYEPPAPPPPSEPVRPSAPPPVTFYTYDPPPSEAETTESPTPPETFPPPAPPAPQPQDTSCPSCGTQLPASATFCFRCGTKVRG